MEHLARIHAKPLLCVAPPKLQASNVRANVHSRQNSRLLRASNVPVPGKCGYSHDSSVTRSEHRAATCHGRGASSASEWPPP